MALTSGFFNSLNGDRVYNANQMSELFEGLITDGVYEAVGNKLAVQPNTGMNVQVNTGRGYFAGKWVKNDSILVLPVSAADTLLNRYDAVVIKVDVSEATRSVSIYLKSGELATSPTKPTMTRTTDVKEYCLGYIYVAAKATSITAANIEDTRSNTSLCGWVVGLIEQIDVNTLYTQFTAQFNDWFTDLVDTLNENTEAMLVAALPKSLTVTIPTTAWTGSGSSYTATATVTGMNTTKSVIISPNSTSVSAYNSSEVKATAQNTNSIIFTATTKPTVDISVDILHMGR